MRHPLNWLVRIRRSPAEALALIGDLEEQYRTLTSRDPGRWSIIKAQGWYVRELFLALAFAISDTRTASPVATSQGKFSQFQPLADVRYALRRWRRRPAFAATAILTLALGIAAATAIFSVVDAVLLRALPWTHPESLVVIHGVYPARKDNVATAQTWNRWYISRPAWKALRATPTFETVATWRPTNPRLELTLGERRNQIIKTMDVSSSFLPMLGVKVVLGRYFDEAEDDAPSDSIILSHETWVNQFGGRASVIGERVETGVATFNERLPRTIVGVLERGFSFQGEAPDILQPVGLTATSPEGGNLSPVFRAVARLAPGAEVSVTESVAAALVSSAPSSEHGTARLVPIDEEQRGAAKRPLWLLFAGAGLLLFIACSNVAGLLLGEARVRRHEMAIRAALGGGRLRVACQLLVEYSLMALAGALMGLLLAYWLLDSMIAIAPEWLPGLNSVAVDLRVAAFALSAGLFTLLVFGVAPALSLSRSPVSSVLAEVGRNGAPGRLLGQRAIVSAQISLALVLLTGASLFSETILRMTSQTLGFDPHQVAVVSTTFAGELYGDPAVTAQAVRSDPKNIGPILNRFRTQTTNIRTDRVLDRISALPGVASVAAAANVPFVATPTSTSAVMDSRPDNERHDVLQLTVTEGYFDTMGMPIRDGRGFSPSDQAASRVAIVSREFERRFFPAGAVQHQFHLAPGSSVEFRIIGVVDNVKRQEFTDEDRPAFYAYSRQGGTPAHFIVRTSGDPMDILPAVKGAIGEASPQLIVTSMVTLRERIDRSAADEAFRATLSAVFGGAALILSAVGLYGLVTRRTADRRREFGVRVALGARPSDVRRLVLREALLIILIGLAVGLPAAYAAAQVTGGLLFGVTPSSPHVFALTAGMLATVALVATLLPASRASKADPILALKE